MGIAISAPGGFPDLTLATQESIRKDCETSVE